MCYYPLLMESIGVENAQEDTYQNFDILLVVPPTYPEGRNPDYNPKPPLGLEYLSGYLKENFLESKIRDFDVVGASAEDVVEEILKEDPPILGITVLQRALPSVKYIHEQLRERGFDKFIIYGGIGATLCAKEILEEFKDPNCIVVLGEGEEPLRRIVETIKQESSSENGASNLVHTNTSSGNSILENYEIHSGKTRKEKAVIYDHIGATQYIADLSVISQDSDCTPIVGKRNLQKSEMTKVIRTRKDIRKRIPSIMYYDVYTKSILKNPLIPLLNLNNIPWPDRQSLEFYTDKSGYLTILTSRGCPWSHCTFCSNAAFEQKHGGDTWRSRSPDDVVKEMIYLYERTNIKKFKTNDPNLFGKGKGGQSYVIDFCNRIQTAKECGLLPEDLSIMSFIRGEDIAGKKDLLKLMKSSGFDRLLIGVESSVDEILLEKFEKGENIRTLNQAVKDLRDIGISPVIGFLIFNPYTTLSTLEQDLQFLEENNLRVNLSKSLRIFNNTPMQFTLIKEGRLEENSPFKTYHEYFVSNEVSAIYHTMKVLHVLVEDPIRKASQDMIWQIKKKGNSFDRRFNYDDLVETFWSIEVELLKAGINFYSQEERGEEIVKNSISKIYNIITERLLSQLLITDKNILIDFDEFCSSVYGILSKRETNNLHEEYVWNEI